MKLSELKSLIDAHIKEDCTGNEPVLITLSNPSVGGRAFTEIKYAGLGIDWEHGQFRIQPKDKLRKEGRTLDDPQKMVVHRYIYNKRNLYSYNCPNCGEKISKTANYCSRCGQRVVYKGINDGTHDYRNNKS